MSSITLQSLSFLQLHHHQLIHSITYQYRGLFRGVAAIFYNKEPARRKQKDPLVRAPIIGLFCAWKPISLAKYPHPSRGLWMRQSGSLWHKIAGASITMKLSTNEGRETIKAVSFLCCPTEHNLYFPA